MSKESWVEEQATQRAYRGPSGRRIGRHYDEQKRRQEKNRKRKSCNNSSDYFRVRELCRERTPLTSRSGGVDSLKPLGNAQRWI